MERLLQTRLLERLSSARTALACTALHRRLPSVESSRAFCETSVNRSLETARGQFIASFLSLHPVLRQLLPSDVLVWILGRVVLVVPV